MSRVPIEGDYVHFVDAEGYIRNALVTMIWKIADENEAPSVNLVSVNLAVVHKDKDRIDVYGRQIDRSATSVPHKSCQVAPGYYWYWPDEGPKVKADGTVA